MRSLEGIYIHNEIPLKSTMEMTHTQKPPPVQRHAVRVWGEN